MPAVSHSRKNQHHLASAGAKDMRRGRRGGGGWRDDEDGEGKERCRFVAVVV